MITDRKKATNRTNSANSSGPRTARGKKNSSRNAQKHGLYSKELIVSDDDNGEFASLREGLLAQFNPSTALQTVAFEQIVASCWRGKLAIRLEMSRLNLQLRTKKESDPSDSEEKVDAQEFDWYAGSPQDLRRGIKFLEALHGVVAESGGLHLESLKEQIIKGFGLGFYNALRDWRPMNASAISLANHLVRHAETFKRPLPNIYDEKNEVPVDGIGASLNKSDTPSEKNVDPSPRKNSAPSDRNDVLVDPSQQWQMLVKLVDMQLQHLRDLLRSGINDPELDTQVLTDFVPRYFTTASRDLQKSVDWFLYLKSQGL